MTVTISAADLTAALKAVLPFVADGTHHPVLHAVRIEAAGRTFTATATDRYTGTHRAATVEGASFPDLAPIFATAGTRETSSLTGPIAINPALLARITDVAARLCPLDMLRLFFTGPEQAVRVEISDWLLFLVMPVRPGGVFRRDGHDDRLVDVPNIPYGLPARDMAEVSS